MKIFFSVGEPSGDLHGANLVRRLRQLHPEVECVGLGGPRMERAGCRLHADMTRLAVMWLLRAIWNLPTFWGHLCRADRYMRRHRPDAVVLIDFPGFNWWIAWRAKAHGIPVFYYGTPQVWAWARWRVNKMRRYVDHALCKLPFEAEWYRSLGVNATYLGHPYFDELESRQLDGDFIADYYQEDRPLVTILPGSRTQEVSSNLVWFLQAAGRVREQAPGVRFAIACFSEKHAAAARNLVKEQKVRADVFVGRTPELIHLADCCMACSGSVSLELLYHAKPSVVLYHVSRAAYWAQTFFRKVKYITLVNLLADRDPLGADWKPYDPDAPYAEIVPLPEYLTWRDKSPQIARRVAAWLLDDMERAASVARLERLRSEHVRGGASNRAAEYILDALGAESVGEARRAA